MPGKHSSVADDDVFIGDNAVEINVFAGYGILHDYTVLYMRVLAHLDTAEYNGIFHRSVNNAAVRN